MRKIGILFLFLVIVQLNQVLSQFAYVRDHVAGMTSSHYFKGWDQVGDSTVFIMDLPPTYPMALYLCTLADPTSYYQNCLYGLSGFTSLMRVKSAKGNAVGGQAQLISYNSTNINHHSSFLTTVTPINGVLLIGDALMDALFGSSITQKFLLISKISQANLSISYLLNNAVINTTLISIKITEVFNKSLIHDGKLIYLFNTGMYIFSANSSMRLIKYIPIPTSAQKISMDVYSQYLIYSVDYQYTVLNLTDYSIILSNSETQLINDIKMMDEHFLVIATTNYIHQYDIDLNKKISNMSYFVGNKRFGLFSRKYLLFYYQFPGYYKNLTVYNISYSYTCDGGCIKCMDTYYVNISDFTCVKNTTAAVNAENNLAQIKIISTALALVSVRVVTPKSFAILMYFMDELPYYNYHHCDYPENMSYSLSSADIVNQLRIKPQFMSFIDVLFSSEIGEKENKDYWKQIPYDERNPDKIYFLNSTESVYKANALMNFLAFALIKLLAAILGCFRERHRFLKVMYLWAWTRSRWWMLVTMFMEANVMELTFSSLMQLLVSSSFVFWNKINFLISIAVLFLVLAYVLTFYPLIYEYSNQKSAETLLIRTKYSFGSFFIEPLYSIVFNFIRAFIHSLLLNFYSTQILCLTIVDSLFLVLIFALATLFINKVAFVCNLLVLVSRLVFDLFLCLDNRNVDIFSYQNFNKIVSTSLYVHIGFFLTLSIAIFLIDFSDFSANYNKINIQQKTDRIIPKDQKILSKDTQKLKYIKTFKQFEQKKHCI